MSTECYLGMRSGDLEGKDYARFWNPEMAPLPAHIQNALHVGEVPAELAFSLEDAGQLLSPGYLSLENGYARLPNGQHFVATRTDMRGVTGAMFEWWMGWHYMEAQRYKLWHPRAHMDNGTAEMRGDDPSLSDREKYMTTHRVTEYVGTHVEEINISFFDPGRFFGDNADLSGGGTTALVCGRVDLQKAPITVGWIIHQIRELDSGTELRSRFWLGRPQVIDSAEHDPRNWLLRSRLFEHLALPKDIAPEMVVHCAAEMNHLAGFLEELYFLYHHNEEENGA